MSLIYKTVSEFDNVWKSTGIYHAPDLGIWAPKCPSGYYYLGHVANLTYDSPTSVRVYYYNSQEDPTLLLPATADNTQFLKVWDDSNIHDAKDTAIWQVKPTVDDYVALGYLASQSGGYDKPDLTNFAYVHQSQLEKAQPSDFNDLTTSSDTDICHFWRLTDGQYDVFISGIHEMPTPLWKLKPTS